MGRERREIRNAREGNGRRRRRGKGGERQGEESRVKDKVKWERTMSINKPLALILALCCCPPALCKTRVGGQGGDDGAVDACGLGCVAC